jgi:peptidoglycan/LPS O-acetylase OafA/YrhL
MIETSAAVAGHRASGYRLLGFYRFSLAMMVVLSHTFIFTFGHGPRVFVMQVGFGNVAVNGFFVLSGFIIAEAVHLFYTGRPGAFLINRALRLVPPFWAATLVSILIHAWLVRFAVLRVADYETPPSGIFVPENLIAQITAIIPIFNVNRLFGYGQERYYFVRYGWAIFVEFVFYYVYAAAMFTWTWARRFISLPVFALAWGGGALALHVINDYVRPIYWALGFAPYFVLGCSLYFMLVSGDRRAKILGFIAYLLVALHFVRYVQGQIGMSVQALSAIAEPSVLVPWLMMLCLPIILLALAPLQVSLYKERIDKWFGDLTYPLYLNHFAVVVAAWSLTERRSWAVQVAVIGLSLVLAYVMKLAVDVPVASARDWVRGTRLLEAKKR